VPSENFILPDTGIDTRIHGNKRQTRYSAKGHVLAGLCYLTDIQVDGLRPAEPVMHVESSGIVGVQVGCRKAHALAVGNRHDALQGVAYGLQVGYGRRCGHLAGIDRIHHREPRAADARRADDRARDLAVRVTPPVEVSRPMVTTSRTASRPV